MSGELPREAIGRLKGVCGGSNNYICIHAAEELSESWEFRILVVHPG